MHLCIQLHELPVVYSFLESVFRGEMKNFAKFIDYQQSLFGNACLVQIVNLLLFVR